MPDVARPGKKSPDQLRIRQIKPVIEDEESIRLPVWFDVSYLCWNGSDGRSITEPNQSFLGEVNIHDPQVPYTRRWPGHDWAARV